MLRSPPVALARLSALSAPRTYLELSKPVSVGDDGRFVAAYPCDRLRLSYTINFDHPLLKHQEYSVEMDETSFEEDIAPAITGRAQHVTLYASSKDRPLQISRNLHEYQRAGDSDPVTVMAPAQAPADCSGA